MKASFVLKSSDGIDLQYYEQPANNPRAVVCLVHGMGEHCGRYSHVADFLNERGFSVIGFDQRGHGKSGGKRGHTPSYDLLQESVSQLIKKAKEHFPELPLFLYGHSMGGNLVLNYAIRNGAGIKAVVASSPYLRLSFVPPAWKTKLANFMGSILPGLQQPTGLATEMLSRDKAVVSAYESDPLVHDKISVSYYLGVENAGEWALAHAAELKVPALVYHGTGDLITSHKASSEFVQKSDGKAELKWWDGLFHETHNEVEKQDILSFMAEWLEKKI